MTHPDLSAAERHIREQCQQARVADRTLATLPTAKLDEMLDEIAAVLEQEAPTLFAENAKDIAAGKEARACTKSLLDRLRITEKSLAAMVTGVRQVRALPQPLGQEDDRMDAAQRHCDLEDTRADWRDRDHF